MTTPDLDQEGLREISADKRVVSAFLVKLTDTSLKALKCSGGKCRLEVKENGGGRLEFPTAPSPDSVKKASKKSSSGSDQQQQQKYEFTLTDLQRDFGQGGLDVISGATGVGAQFSFVGPIRQKIQINATEASFGETKQKAKLQEELRKSGAKEVKGPKHQQQKKTSPPAPLGPANSTSETTISAAASKTAGKSLRSRILHLIALKAYKKEEVKRRLQKEGLSPADEKQFDTVLAEVGASVRQNGAESDPKIILKPSLLKTEVDINWPGYGPWERQTLKSKVSGGGSRSPPNGNGPVQTLPGFQKKTEPLPPQAPVPKSTILDDLLPPSGNQSLKRKGPTPPYEEEVCPPNLNSPEDGDTPPVPKKVRQAHQPPAPAPHPPPVSTSSPKNLNTSPPTAVDQEIEVPGIPVVPIDTAVPDWSKEFPPIRTTEERQKYARAFAADYDEYGTLHKKLADVSKEFGNLEKRFKTCKNAKEVKKLEEEIETKYYQYVKDEEFLGIKRRHDELRSKLAFIKDRVKEWDFAVRDRRVTSLGKTTPRNASTPSSASSSPEKSKKSEFAVPSFRENNRATDLTVM